MVGHPAVEICLLAFSAHETAQEVERSSKPLKAPSWMFMSPSQGEARRFEALSAHQEAPYIRFAQPASVR